MYNLPMPDHKPNLIPQPDLAAPFDQPAGWRTWTPREAIRPAFGGDGPAAHIGAAGKLYVHGKLRQVVPDIRPGQALQASVRVRKTGRSLARMRIAFQDETGQYLDKFWVEPESEEGGWQICRGRMTAPEKTARVEVELCFTGRGDEAAWFAAPQVTLAEPERRSTVKVAVVHRDRIYDTYEEALAGYVPRIAEAAQLGADFVVLTELLSCRASTQECAEPLDGPIATALAEAARENAIHVVTSLPERDGDLAYNAGVLFDRTGALIGKYRKVHLPPQEIDGGTTEGDEFPVFDTEFGKVGMMVCYDYFFPETTFMLAHNGAQIVFLPIWGGHLQPGMWDAVTRARAADNGVHLVAAGIDVSSRVVRSDGVVVADRSEPGISVGGLPLIDGKAPQLRVWPWCGTWPWRNCYATERRNDVYGGCLEGSR